MAAFKPGLSPPAVKMPMRLVLVIVSATFESAKGVVCREQLYAVRSRLRAELTLSQQAQENEAIHRHANRDRRAELKRQVFISQPHVMPSSRNLERLERIIRTQQMRRLAVHINAPVVIIRLRYDHRSVERPGGK